MLEQFSNNVELQLQKKVDRTDFELFKSDIDSQLNEIRMNQKETVPPEDGAAGIRKQLLPDFHCISCDRPVDVYQNEAVPSLPVGQALPGNRATRPYTTFELEQIRKHIRGSGNKGKFDASQEREKLQKQLLRLWYELGDSSIQITLT